MKKLGIAVATLLALTVFFGTKDMSVGDAMGAGIQNIWGAINILFGGNVNASNNQRPLPQNQGDDSETITPIESLESIE